MIIFKPLGVMQNGHLQTILPSILPFNNSLKTTEEIIQIPMSNGDIIQTKVNFCSQGKKAAFLVHGLEGSSEARYMVQTAYKLNQEGYTVVRINLRNCGGTEKLSQSLYNAGMSDDLDAIIKFYQKYKWDEFFLIGFSLGANLVGKYTGEKGNAIDGKIKKVILISPPLDLGKTLVKMSRGFSQVYNSHFTKLLKAKYNRKCAYHPHVFDKKILNRIKNLLDFDNLITGPYFGFKNAQEYYDWGSSIKYIQNSQVPVYILQAMDDPIVDASDHQELLKKDNKNLRIILTEKGGHVGFWGYGNGNQKANSWLSQTILQLILE